MQVVFLTSRLYVWVQWGVEVVGGAEGLVGIFNADRASGDKDPHWCQQGEGVIY